MPGHCLSTGNAVPILKEKLTIWVHGWRMSERDLINLWPVLLAAIILGFCISLAG
jgi:hypothetical protein